MRLKEHLSYRDTERVRISFIMFLFYHTMREDLDI